MSDPVGQSVEPILQIVGLTAEALSFRLRELMSVLVPRPRVSELQACGCQPVARDGEVEERVFVRLDHGRLIGRTYWD